MAGVSDARCGHNPQAAGLAAGRDGGGPRGRHAVVIVRGEGGRGAA